MPVTVTTRGYIEVWRGELFISRHRVETEAIESAIAHALEHGDGDYEILFPRKTLSVSKLTRTIVVDTIAPTAPSSLVATAGTNQVVLTWGASFDANGVTHYDVYRGGSLVNSVAGTVLTFTDTTVGPSTTYSYTVRARDGAGNTSSASNTATVTTGSLNTPPYWSDTLGDSFTIYPDQPFSFTFTATDDEADAIAFLIGAYDSSVLTITQNAQVGNDRTITISGSGANLTAGDSYTVSVDLADASQAEITTLGISGAGAWTFGQAFKQGDAPAFVAIADGQADVRNRWPDGSVKFAVLSKVSTGAETVSITTSATNTMTGSVPLSSAFTTNPPRVEFTGGVVGTATCPTSDSVSGWSKTTAHLVRKIAGSVMTERHYYAPVIVSGQPHDHLAVWFYVRSYSDGSTEVETVVENGWLLVASPGAVAYTAAVWINGAQVTAPTIAAHSHHTRWSRTDWYGASPGIVPRHDPQYLQSTSLVPTLAVDTRTASFYSTKPAANNTNRPFTAWTEALADRPTPYDLANIDAALGSGGESEGYGVVPLSAIAYLVEADPRTYYATVGNGRAQGRYCLHYRDENDGRPVRGSQYPLLGLAQTNVGISGNSGQNPQLTPVPTGSLVAGYTFSHGPATSFPAYLLTGRWSFLEAVQFLVGSGELMYSGAYAIYNGYRCTDEFELQMRTRAWHWRNRSQAISITPQYLAGVEVTGADAAQRAEMVGRVTADVDRAYDYLISGVLTGRPAAVRGNALGMYFVNSDYAYMGTVVDGQQMYNGLMTNFNAMAVLYGYDTNPLDDEAKMTKYAAIAEFTARYPVGMFGGKLPEWDWQVCTYTTLSFGTPGYDGNNLLTFVPRASWADQWAYITQELTWFDGTTFPLPQTNRMRWLQAEGNDPMRCSSMAFLPFLTDVYSMSWALSYAHKVADSTAARGHPISGVDLAMSRLLGSETWANSFTNSFVTDPRLAYTTDRPVA